MNPSANSISQTRKTYSISQSKRKTGNTRWEVDNAYPDTRGGHCINGNVKLELPARNARNYLIP